MTTAAVFSALAVALALPAAPQARLRRVLGRAGGTPRGPRLRDADLWTSPTFAALLAGFGVTRFVDGSLGIALGIATAFVVRRWIGTLESVRARRRRERIERDLPMALDLTVAALGAGRPPAQALDLVGSAIGGPLAEDLAAITARLDLGADPLQVWRRAAEQPGLRPLGRAFARATQTGASVTVVLARGVDDLRSERRAEAQRVARAAGVRTAAPLGACFLPAFVVVGIVPTLVSVFERFVL